MSVANIFTSDGVIAPQYLPTGPAPAHPYVENPFQDPVDGGNQPLTNLQSLVIGAAAAPPVGTTLDVAGNVRVQGKIAVDAAQDAFIWETGGDIEVVNTSGPTAKFNYQGPAGVGEVYDTVNNPPPLPHETPYVVQQLTATVAGPISVSSGSPKTLATLNFNAVGADKDSYVCYVNIQAMSISGPNPAQFLLYLNESLDGDLDLTVGSTTLSIEWGGVAGPITPYLCGTLVLRSPAPITTLYLNCKQLTAVPGVLITNITYTIDGYASKL